jgi:hypothetical protein
LTLVSRYLPVSAEHLNGILTTDAGGNERQGGQHGQNSPEDLNQGIAD